MRAMEDERNIMPPQRDIHPWDEFPRLLRDLDRDTWMQLGEAVSRCEHISGAPMEPEAERKLHTAFLVKGALASVAVEGKDLNEESVREYIGVDLKLPPPGMFPEQKINNIVDACESIAGIIEPENGYARLSIEDIRDLNRQVLKDLKEREDAVPGELRRHSVVVGIARSVPARDCGTLLEQFCAWLNEMEFPIGMEKPFSILAAIASHLYLVWIHPFGDGNGRTARLIEYRLLLEAGFTPAAAQLLSIFYARTRSEYFRQLDRANRSGTQMSGFFTYAIRGLIAQLRGQILVIQDLQRKTIEKMLLMGQQ